jgi:hypothetical protein
MYQERVLESGEVFCLKDHYIERGAKNSKNFGFVIVVCQIVWRILC